MRSQYTISKTGCDQFRSDGGVGRLRRIFPQHRAVNENPTSMGHAIHSSSVNWSDKADMWHT